LLANTAVADLDAVTEDPVGTLLVFATLPLRQTFGDVAIGVAIDVRVPVDVAVTVAIGARIVGITCGYPAEQAYNQP